VPARHRDAGKHEEKRPFQVIVAKNLDLQPTPSEKGARRGCDFCDKMYSVASHSSVCRELEEARKRKRKERASKLRLIKIGCPPYCRSAFMFSELERIETRLISILFNFDERILIKNKLICS
jgi:hypothetical protein